MVFYSLFQTGLLPLTKRISYIISYTLYIQLQTWAAIKTEIVRFIPFGTEILKTARHSSWPIVKKLSIKRKP